MSKRIKIIAGSLAVAALCAAALLWHDATTSPFRIDDDAFIHILPNADTDDVEQQLRSEARADNLRLWHLLTTLTHYTPRSGRYVVRPADTMLDVFRRLRSGAQEPVRLVVPSTRGLHRMAGAIARHTMLDSALVAAAFADTTFIASTGYTPETFPALFIPDTYEVYWDTPLDALIERLQRENDAFWQQQGRTAAADSLGLTREEVYTLASIVDEETAATAEKPDVAGLYLNRLRMGMPLQADPTVKYAVGDETLRRIRGNHLAIESAYNTYQHAGLPPGPIRIASKAGIDAVIHPTSHTYIYVRARGL